VPNELRLEKRGGVFYAVGTFDGKRIRTSLKTRDETEAKRQCSLYQTRLWERRSFGEAAIRTFEEAALSYLAQGGEGRFLPPVLKHFKGRSLSSIAPGDVREMAITLYPRAAPATRNRNAIIPARAVIRHGHSRGWCGPLSVELFPVPKPRKHKPVARQWLDAFMTQADRDGLSHLSGIVLFMHQTGARAGEAVRLCGEDVNLAARKAVLVKTKTEEDSVRHLTTELVVRMAALGLRDGERVFRYTDPKAVNRRMAAVCRRAGIEVRSTHSAGRHSFATNAMASGAKVKDAMDAGGWKSAKLFVETYVHSDDAGRSVAELFDANSPHPIKVVPNKDSKSNG
jgi:integrase